METKTQRPRGRPRATEETIRTERRLRVSNDLWQYCREQIGGASAFMLRLIEAARQSAKGAPEENASVIVLHVPPYLAEWFAAQEWAGDPEMQEQERIGRLEDAVARLKRQEIESRII